MFTRFIDFQKPASLLRTARAWIDNYLNALDSIYRTAADPAQRPGTRSREPAGQPLQAPACPNRGDEQPLSRKPLQAGAAASGRLVLGGVTRNTRYTC